MEEGSLVSTPSLAVTVFRELGHGHSDWCDVVLLQPCVPGNELTQKDNADSGVQFITLVDPRQSLLLAKDPTHFCESLIYAKCMSPNSLKLV